MADRNSPTHSIVKVLVGSASPAVFLVHEEQICDASAFFKCAMRNGWKESEEKMVHLEDENPQLFMAYLRWLQSRVISIPSSTVPGEDDFLQLAKAYVLGDMLQDDDFTDAVTDAIIEKCFFRRSDPDPLTFLPGGPAITHVYENTPGDCLLRRLLVDLYLCHVQKLGEREQYPYGFLYDLMAVSICPCGEDNMKSIGEIQHPGAYRLAHSTLDHDSLRRIGPDDSKNPLANPWDTCEYHRHVKALKPCYKTKGPWSKKEAELSEERAEFYKKELARATDDSHRRDKLRRANGYLYNCNWFLPRCKRGPKKSE